MTRMRKIELINEQKIQLKTQIIQIKEFVAKVKKKLRTFTALIIIYYHPQIVFLFDENLFLQINV